RERASSPEHGCRGPAWVPAPRFAWRECQTRAADCPSPLHSAGRSGLNQPSTAARHDRNAMTDIATRVYNHTWKIDPIVRSVLDTDFYKLLMAQTIFRRLKEVRVTFGIINRSESIKLGRLIDIGELKEQLDHIRTLRLSRGESTWLRGNMFY